MADGITIRAENLRLDGKKFSKAMNTELEALFVEAARAFLIATVRRIPIRTGFLRGAFTRLEDVVGAYQLGASKKPPSLSGKRGTGPATRPNRDAVVVARRLVRLRETQRRLLRRIKKIQLREAERRTTLNKKLSELQNRQGGFVHEKQLNAILRVNRAKAIRDRAHVQFFLEKAHENESKIGEAVRRYESKTKFTLRSKANDERSSKQLQILTIQQTRNEKFQSLVKLLKRRFFGFTNSRQQRVPGTMSKEIFDKRLARIREAVSKPTKLQEQLRRSLSGQGAKISERLKSKLKAYQLRLTKKYADRLEEARLRDDDETIKDINREIAHRVARAAKRIQSKKTNDPFIGLLQRQARAEAQMSAEAVDRLQHELQLSQGRLNVVARTTRGRIVGQNIPGKFNLESGESVKKIFNKSGHDRLEEFYYPVKGAPQSRILKTPRSGRKFATPAEFIIQKVTKPQPSGLGLLKQLAGILGPTGRTVDPAIQAAIRDVNDTVSFYQFNFTVDISYLAINDIRKLWGAWDAGVNAFNQVIINGAARRLPQLADFMLVETRRLSSTSRSKQVSGRA
jgi:hypothetical protein